MRFGIRELFFKRHRFWKNVDFLVAPILVRSWSSIWFSYIQYTLCDYLMRTSTVDASGSARFLRVYVWNCFRGRVNQPQLARYLTNPKLESIWRVLNPCCNLILFFPPTFHKFGTKKSHPSWWEISADRLSWVCQTCRALYTQLNCVAYANEYNPHFNGDTCTNGSFVNLQNWTRKTL